MPMIYIKSSIWSGFEIKNWIEDQFQSSPKLVGIWTVQRCIFVPNLEIVISIGGESWPGQAQNGINFDFEVKFDLEGQCQSPPKNNRVLNQGLSHLWSKFGDPCLNWWWVIARTSSWLTHGRTDTQTDAGNDNTRRPKLASGKNYHSKNAFACRDFIKMPTYLYFLKSFHHI